MDSRRCTQCHKIKSLTEFSKRSSRPIGYKPVCKLCSNENALLWRNNNRDNIALYNKKIYDSDPDYARTRVRNYYSKIRVEIVNRYGGKCTCCGESIYEFLTLDHVNNDGHEHRKVIGRGIEKWIIDNNYPNSIQLLCYNCNMGKTKNKEHVCPHRIKRSQTG